MHAFDACVARVRATIALLFGYRHDVADESRFDEEFEFHVAMATEKNVRAGMSPDEARRVALLAFGGRTHMKEGAMEERRSRPLQDFVRDLKFGFRTLGRERSFAIATIGTTALGIAGAVTVFSFVDALFLRPLRVPSGDRVVHVRYAGQHGERQWLGLDAARLLRQQTRSFDVVAVHRSRAMLNAIINNESSSQFAAFISSDYFRALGLRPALGRFFVASEDSVPDRDYVVVIAYSVWQTAFAGDSAVLGQTIHLRGQALRIVGVAPRGFDGVAVGGFANTLWLPTALLRFVGPPCVFQHPCREVSVLARLAPGASAAQADAELATLSKRLSAASFGDDSLRIASVIGMMGLPPEYRGEYVAIARLLSGIAALLLVIACANLSGLLLARGVARRREVALRLSLGASRLRIVRQMLTESLTIALIGGAIGTWWSTIAVGQLMGLFAADSEGFRHLYYFTLDRRGLGVALALSIVTTLAFGVLPALSTARTDPAETIKEGSARVVGARLRLTLIASQVSLSLALLVGATLLTRSYARLMEGQLFDARHVAMLRIRPTSVPYDVPQSHAYLARLVEKLESLPEVESVAFRRNWGMLWHHSTWEVSARRPSAQSPYKAELHSISPRFFATLKIPVLMGREFAARDRPGAPLVAMVNARLAGQLWPGQRDVIGQTITLEDSTFRVVGVVPDYEVHAGNEAPHPAAYIPFWQNPLAPEMDARLAVRVRRDAAAALPALRAAAMQVDPAVPITEMLPMTDQVSATFSELELGKTVMVAAAGVALLLCGLGLYGLVAFLAARRTREIGVRMALGAGRNTIVGMFIRQGMIAVTCGIVVGLAGALVATKALSSWLIDVPPLDIPSFAIALSLVAGIAAMASYLPARRAAAIDPVSALRSD